MSIWTIRQAREWLESARAEHQDDLKLRKLDYAVGRIVTFLEEEYLFPTTNPAKPSHLESQPQTPSESISPASAGASPETTTESSASQSPQPESATTAPTSFLSGRGQALVFRESRATPVQPSKTPVPTPSTSETAPDTGRSASTGECQGDHLNALESALSARDARIGELEAENERLRNDLKKNWREVTDRVRTEVEALREQPASTEEEA